MNADEMFAFSYILPGSLALPRYFIYSLLQRHPQIQN